MTKVFILFPSPNLFLFLNSFLLTANIYLMKHVSHCIKQKKHNEFMEEIFKRQSEERKHLGQYKNKWGSPTEVWISSVLFSCFGGWKLQTKRRNFASVYVYLYIYTHTQRAIVFIYLLYLGRDSGIQKYLGHGDFKDSLLGNIYQWSKSETFKGVQDILVN